MNFEEKTHEISNELDCHDCGALLKYATGTEHLKCEYCGAENEILETAATTVVEETDFSQFLDATAGTVEQYEVVTAKCGNCGASSTLKPGISSDSCPFCASPIVVTGGTTHTIVKPRYLLPFKIDQKTATGQFTPWVKSLWFAPNDLKHAANTTDKLNGMYIPYWTYDAKTQSGYTGQRGDDYTDTETYSTMEDGKSVTKTRTVTKTRWHSVSGNVYDQFDDILVLASNSLPEKHTAALEPWDLESLVDYSDSYLSGFRTESYQVDVKSGFEKSKVIMDEEIQRSIRRDIGGDHQRISSVQTVYGDVSFKHILLPVWISAYRYKNRIFRFIINGRTGEVQGERPYSVLKITLAILAAIAVIVTIVLLVKRN